MQCNTDNGGRVDGLDVQSTSLRYAVCAARVKGTMPQTFNVGSRSLFVSVTAWVFIVLGLGASALSVIQGASIASLLPAFHLSLDGKPLQGLMKVLTGHLPWVAAAALTLSFVTFAASIVLLLLLLFVLRSLPLRRGRGCFLCRALSPRCLGRSS